MIISEKLKYVYVSVPKAGTHTMYAFLTDHCKGRHLSLLRGRRDTIPYHIREVPEKYCGPEWVTFTVVRNPFIRAVSLWWSLTKHPLYAKTYKPLVGSSGFPEFAQWLASGDVRQAPHGSGTLLSQSEWLNKVPRMDHVLHLENVLKEFNALPFVAKPIVEIEARLVRTLDPGRNPWWEYYDDEATVEAVKTWATGDFSAYGYSEKPERG